MEAKANAADAARERVRHYLEDPQRTLDELDRIECEESLLAFVKLLWPVLEPGRPFIDGWAIRAIIEHLEAVTAGQITRLLINVPPNFSKSVLLNIFWPAWEWGPKRQPELRYLSLSYSEKLSIRDNRKCRMLMQSRPYQRLWGDVFQFSGDQNAKLRYENDHAGVRLAGSTRGSTLGERGDRVNLDDPNNSKKAESEADREEVLNFFTEILPTRVYDPKLSTFVVSQQRVHERDVSGLILEKELDYEHLCIPMEYEHDHPYKSVTSLGFEDPRRADGELAWPERFDAASVKSLKKTLASKGGDYAIAGQLQQRPAPRGGGMFQRKDFLYADAAPAEAIRVRGWDLAASEAGDSAFTVGVKMAMTSTGRAYIEDIVRGQWNATAVEDAIKRTAEQDGSATTISIPQDPGQAGKSQKTQFARLLHGYNVHFSLESGSKVDRAKPLAAQAGGGNLILVRGPWNDAFIAEASTFPRGHWDDQVDAASRAYAKLLTMEPEGPIFVGPRVVKG